MAIQAGAVLLTIDLCPIWTQVYHKFAKYYFAVRVIARRTLSDFVESLRGSKDYKALKAALDAWFHEARVAIWNSPAEVKESYRNASIVGEDRVVFNIKGNDYRLVVAINYEQEIVFIKWLGTHKEYDQY